uniref:Uncharacterized protein n=1 Tax=Gasterosteus aculeatus TaxID=69293 RepID=G3P9Q4_GASAC
TLIRTKHLNDDLLIHPQSSATFKHTSLSSFRPQVPESCGPPESRPAQVPLTCSTCIYTHMNHHQLHRLNYVVSREEASPPGGDSPSYREHRDTEEPGLDQNPNPG